MQRDVYPKRVTPSNYSGLRTSNRILIIFQFLTNATKCVLMTEQINNSTNNISMMWTHGSCYRLLIILHEHEHGHFITEAYEILLCSIVFPRKHNNSKLTTVKYTNISHWTLTLSFEFNVLRRKINKPQHILQYERLLCSSLGSHWLR